VEAVASMNVADALMKKANVDCNVVCSVFLVFQTSKTAAHISSTRTSVTVLMGALPGISYDVTADDDPARKRSNAGKNVDFSLVSGPMSTAIVYPEKSHKNLR
jgi:hypothetical protein